MKKKLYRSSNDKKICGVCGGIAEYFDIDSTIVRIIYIVLSLLPGVPGILLYIILAFVIPQDDGYNNFDGNNDGSNSQ